METLSNKIKILLSDKRITIAILFIVIASRLIQLIFFYNLIVDASYQVLATQNFVHGHGISLAYVNPTDLSRIIYQPLINWPPGYSLLLSPLYLLFEPNYIAAGLALDFIAATTLIFTSRAILRLFEIPVYLINIFSLVVGFYIYYFYFNPCSDAIAVSLFVIALYYTLLFLKTGTHWLRQTIIISCILTACAFTKYLYMPVVFIIPVVLTAKGFVSSNPKIRKAGLLSFFILLTSISALLFYQKIISGSATYISQPERGFFPQHVLDSFPFIPISFVKADTMTMLILQHLNVNKIIFHIYQFVHLFLFLFSIYLITRSFIKGRFRKLSLTEDYFYFLFFIAFSVTLLLVFLSVRVAKEEIFPGLFWTYVEEPRYYGLPSFLIHIGVFVFYAWIKERNAKRYKYVFCFFILLFVPEVFRGLVFDFNRIRFFGKETYSWQYEDRFQRYADGLLKRELKNQHVPVVLTGTSYYMNNRISLYSHVPILEKLGAINDLSSLHTKHPILLLVAMEKKFIPAFQTFLSSNPKLVGQFNEFYFYIVYVQPH